MTWFKLNIGNLQTSKSELVLKLKLELLHIPKGDLRWGTVSSKSPDLSNVKSYISTSTIAMTTKIGRVVTYSGGTPFSK